MYWNLLIYVISCVVILWMFFSNKNSKKKFPRSIPGPKPSSAENGNLEEIRAAGGLHPYLLRLHREWGPITTFRIGPQPVVSIASADLFKQQGRIFDRPGCLFEKSVILTGHKSIQMQNGEEGKRMHKTFSRPFAFDRCKNYYGSFLEIAKELLEKLESLPPSSHIPVWENMIVVALKGILKTAFGHRLADDKTAMDINQNYELAWQKIESFFQKSDPKDFDEEQVSKATRWYRKFAQDMLEARQPATDKLFVDVLLEYDEDVDCRVDNAVTFITGGFHTTSGLLTWALYFLAENQDVQEKAHSEAIEVLGDGDVTPENIKNLEYFQQILDESLRLSTLAPYAARYSEKDTVLGGYDIAANTPVLHALGVLLGDASVWDCPDKFDPDRFRPENVQNRNSLAFCPFGFAGKRICPGYRFAYVECTVILATLLRGLRFRMVEGQNIGKSYGLVTKPSSEIWMTVERWTL